MNRVYIALGSNLGHRTKALKLALHQISQFAVVERISTFIETKPQEVKGKQPKYINAVALIHTKLQAKAILDRCEDIEKQLGRDLLEKGQYRSRPIDIDIIAFNDEVIESSDLLVPHPRMHKRDFVLVPLKEIAPDWVHPVLKLSVTDLLDQLES